MIGDSTNMETSAMFYCGTSNVELPVPNKSHFPAEYQERSRLCYYASLFNTVEINSSFYKIPLRKTVEKWAADVPADFRFTFKLWKGITHTKELNYDPADLHRFMASINGAGDKKGCLLLQLPASVKISYYQKLRNLLDELHAADGMHTWKVAIEFRDKSWHGDNVYELLDGYRCAVVKHDMPASATPEIDMDAPFVYLRFHGEKGDYRGSYQQDILQDTALSIEYEMSKGLPVFAYFNNTIGAAVANAAELKRYVNIGK